MTKSSPQRAERKTMKRKIASDALQVAAHGRLIEVDVDGKAIKMWCMPASAQSVVMSALRALA